MTRANSNAWGRVLAALALLAGCHRAPLRTTDLEEIQASGELRVIVRPGFLAPPVCRTGRVDQRVLLRQLAARLHLELRYVEAERNDQLLPWLLEGRGDLAAASYPPAALDRHGLTMTAPVDWVADVVVAGPHSGPRTFAELPSYPLYLQRSVEPWLLPASWTLAGRRPPVVPVPEETPFEEILRRVSSGRYAASVVDSALLEGNPDIEVRVLGPVSGRRPLVWAVRDGDPHLLAVANDFLFAEQVLSRTSRVVACRDLDQVRAARVLRIVTRSSPTTCVVEGGGEAGFQYELARAFASRLRVRLELSIPPPGVDPLDWLESGYGDLAALHEPVDPEVEAGFLVSRPVRVVDLVSVVPAARPAPAAVEDLAGQRVAAAAPVEALCRLLPIEPPLRPIELVPGSDALTALHKVARGEAQVAVIDDDTARFELPEHPELQRGPIVLPGASLVWVLNPSSAELYEAVEGFLTSAEASGLLRQLVADQLLQPARPSPASLLPVPAGALSPFDEALRRTGATVGIDWRLLAAVMYEESRFDPTAIGPGGAAGLFQLMPSTRTALGVEDPLRPEQAVEAGSRYLRQLMDLFPGMPARDRLAMAIAAFNAGPTHVLAARRLAREMGLDPDRWGEGVEQAMLALDDPEVARRLPNGVCPCRRAVGFTRRILERHQVYSERFPS